MTMKPARTVLIVDDDAAVCALYSASLTRAGYRVLTAPDLAQMRQVVRRTRLFAVLLDVQLGKEDGLEALPFLVKEAPLSRIIVLTANATIGMVVAAMRAGAAAVVPKSSTPAQLVEQIALLAADAAHDGAPGEGAVVALTGKSAAAREVNELVQKLRPVDSAVLLLGESGTGKEVVARALHASSTRAMRHFGSFNCSAIPAALLESELFGHCKGAFTDATADRKGIFEICDGGTLLLDEIGDMPLAMQAKLLRVLQQREVTPVGAGKALPVDVRVIAATHCDLGAAMAAKTFREDLYHRLSVVVLTLPPLRQRLEDIPLLVRTFVAQLNHRFGRAMAVPSDAVLAGMMTYAWPGNVRELHNAVERAFVFASGTELPVDQLVSSSRCSPSYGAASVGMEDAVFGLPLTVAKQEFEKAYLDHALRTSNGNISEVARQSGRFRADIYRLKKRYDFEAELYRR
jgi:DNA-binding NtrC family response regulator